MTAPTTPWRTALVEDDAAFRASLASAAMQSPMFELVGAAADLPEGLALMRERRPELLLVDLQLPSGSGRVLIEAAARELPECEVVVISTLADDDSVVAALAAGAVGYLLKTAQIATLVEQLAGLHEGGSPMSPVIARKLLRLLAPGRAGQGASAGVPTPTGAPGGGEVPRLSERELAVLHDTALGYRFDEIAARQGVSVHTIATYAKRCYRKLQAHSKTQAVARARHFGLIG
jgi:DNA-binding NarL/FixJ family response regulator